jgi:hypothetical protein
MRYSMTFTKSTVQMMRHIQVTGHASRVSKVNRQEEAESNEGQRLETQSCEGAEKPE